jgi:hypothetical protein
MVSSVGTGRRIRVKTQRMVDRLECRDRPPRPGRQEGPANLIRASAFSTVIAAVAWPVRAVPDPTSALD